MIFGDNRSIKARSNKRSNRARRGVAGVIAGVILVAILLTSVFSFFFIIMQGQTVKTENELGALELRNEKMREILSTRTNELLSGPQPFEQGEIQIWLNNTGSIPIKITKLLVYNTTSNISPAPEAIDPLGGNSLTINDGESRLQTISGYITTAGNVTYRIDAITDRGNIISGTWPPPPKTPSLTEIFNTSIFAANTVVAQGLGSISLDFRSFGVIFRNYVDQGSVNQTGWYVQASKVPGYPGFRIPGETSDSSSEIYLIVRVKNVDSSGQNMTLMHDTGLILSITDQSNTQQSVPLFLCYADFANHRVKQYNEDDATAKIILPNAFGPQFNQDYGWVNLVFCDKEQSLTQFDPHFKPGIPSVNITPVFMIFRAEFEDQNRAYGQTIPYQAIAVTAMAKEKPQNQHFTACLKSTTTDTCATDTSDKYKGAPGDLLYVRYNNLANDPGTPYKASWINPDGTSQILASGAASNPITSTVPSNKPAGFYIIQVSDNEDNVYYLTFEVTGVNVSASPDGGTFGTDQSISLTASDPSATIYYTTDGSNPTTSSPEYSGTPILVSGATGATSTTILRFFAVDTEGNPGMIFTESYIIDKAAPAVTASPAGGEYFTSQSVTLSASEPSTIHYTTDGSNPTTSSPAYANPIIISSNTTLKFIARDSAGNESPVSTETYTITDNIPPGAPIITSPSTGSTTDDNTPTISGTSEPSSTVQVFVDGALVGTITASAGGSWSFTPSTGLTYATHTITAKALDGVGNESPESSAITLIIQDNISPTGSVTINSGAQFTTSTSVTLTLTCNDGTGSGCTQMRISTDGALDGESYIAFATTSSIILPSGDGSKTVLVQFRDAVGNASPTVSDTISLDTSSPFVTITSPANNAQLNSPQVTVTGTASDSGSNIQRVQYRIDSSGPFTDASGTTAWTFTTSALSDGTYTINVRAQDFAGFTFTVPITVIVDTVAPGAPTITSPSSGAVTNNNTPVITGTAPSGVTSVRIFDGPTQIGSAIVTSGSWSFTPSTAISDGSHSITARSVDAAGNISGSSTPITVIIDTTAPAVSTPSVSPSPTNANPTVTATATDTARNIAVAEFFIDSVGANGAGTAMAASDGSFNSQSEGISGTIVISTLTQGTHTVYVHARDSAGNWGSAFSQTTFTVDTLAPASPAIDQPTSPTNDNTPTIMGTKEANTSIQLFDSNGITVIGSTAVDSSTTWSITTSTLSDGTHTLTAKAIDTAGNISPSSASENITIDTSSPGAPSITDPSGSLTTNDNTPTISGTAEPSSTVEVFRSGTISLGTTAASVGGSWTFSPSAMSDGAHSITARATDEAGNVSPASSSRSISIDTVSPSVSITSPSSGTTLATTTPTIQGTSSDTGGTGIQTIEVSVDGGAYSTATGTTSWSFTTLPLSEGSHTITVRATDNAGNIQTTSTTITIDITEPSVTITSPNDSDTLSPGTITVEGTASDDFGLLRVEVSVDAGSYNTAFGTTNWLYNTSSLSSGPHTISSRAVDDAGNISAVVTINITIT